jgi:hypothetical protein
MVDGSSTELLRELNEKRKTVRLMPPVAALAAVVVLLMLAWTVPPWVIGLFVGVSVALCWWLWRADEVRKTTVIFYNLQPDVERAYQQLHDAFGELRSCCLAWHVQATGVVTDRKYHAGAGAVVSRKEAALKSGQPPFVKTNVEMPMIPVGRQVLAFAPDSLLVFDVAAVGAVSYRDLNLSVAETRFVEDGGVPRDATVVGKTWRYVNRSGGPDRRFKNNSEIPVCLYEELHFSSATGLNEMMQVSRRGVGAVFQAAIAAMRELRPS